MKLTTFGLSIATAAVCLGTAIAQEPAPVISIGREAIKEGRSTAHEKVEYDWARTFRKANFPYHWLGMTPMNGASEVWFVNFYSSFADIEKSDKQVESTALRNESDLLDARDGELRSGSTTQYAVFRKDMSYGVEKMNLGKARYAIAAAYHVKLGHQQEFMDGDKLFRTAMA